MGIKFSVHETPQPAERISKKLRHARALRGGTKKMDDICAVICARSSISSADVKAVLDSLVWMMELSLKNGDHIELEELGHFSPSLRTRKEIDGKYSVAVDGVNFRCSDKLKKELRNTALEKEKKLCSCTLEERKMHTLEYLKHNEHITARGYAELNSCSRYRADADLKLFVESKLLYRIGYGTHVMYLKGDTE